MQFPSTICFIPRRSRVSHFQQPLVLVCFLAKFDLLFAFGVLSCQILDWASLFILYVHEQCFSQKIRLQYTFRGVSRTSDVVCPV